MPTLGQFFSLVLKLEHQVALLAGSCLFLLLFHFLLTHAASVRHKLEVGVLFVDRALFFENVFDVFEKLVRFTLKLCDSRLGNLAIDFDTVEGRVQFVRLCDLVFQKGRISELAEPSF